MKTPLLLLFLLGMTSLFGQTSFTKNRNKGKVFEIGAQERIMHAKVIYEQGKGKKGRSILRRIIQQELDTKIDTAKHGIYSTIAALNLYKIDSLEGMRYLHNLYKHFQGLTCTECKNNRKRIERQIRDWSGKGYKEAYEIICFLEDHMNPDNTQQLMKQNIKISQEIDSIRFYSFSMGGGFDIMMSEEMFMYQRGSWNSKIIEDPKKMDKLEWNGLLTKLQKIKIEEIPEIEQPSGSRHIDGANYSTITIYIDQEKFVSRDFDDFRPSKELQPVVHYIRYLLRKKLNY